MSALVRRRIDATITLGGGDKFGDMVSDTITVTGLRIMAAINSVGGEAQGQATIRIFGLDLSTMNKLTSIGPILTQIRLKNTIQLSAGDEGGAMTVVFNGVINTAYAELNSAPDVALTIVAFSAMGAAIKPVAASSFVGGTDVGAIMQGLANQAGFAFKNDGVTKVLSNPYFSGTILDQIKSCARAAGINHAINNNVLKIWPAGTNTTDPVIRLSPSTGLVGYPTLNSQYIMLRSVFIPNAALGQQVEVSGSEVSAVNGTWTIFTVMHNLEAQTPGGQWFTELQVFTNGN